MQWSSHISGLVGASVGGGGGGGGSDPLQLVYYDGNVIMVACTLRLM